MCSDECWCWIHWDWSLTLILLWYFITVRTVENSSVERTHLKSVISYDSISCSNLAPHSCLYTVIWGILCFARQWKAWLWLCFFWYYLLNVSYKSIIGPCSVLTLPDRGMVKCEVWSVCMFFFLTCSSHLMVKTSRDLFFFLVHKLNMQEKVQAFTYVTYLNLCHTSFNNHE